MPFLAQPDIGQSRAHLMHRLVDSNPGAAMALIDLLHCGRRFGEPVSEEVNWCLTMLDALSICGTDLDVFWGDVCCHSVDEMFSLLRACHEGRGGVSCNTIRQAIACCNPFRELQLASEVSGL